MITLILFLTVISRVFYGRSLMATLAEWFLFLTEKRYTDKELYDLLKKKTAESEPRYVPPAKIFGKIKFNEKDFNGMQVFYFNQNPESQTAVIYLHGGAYFRKPRRWHWKFIKKLCKNTGVPFIVPIYPKAPKHTCERVYKTLTNFYTQVISTYRNVILAGDSSGGGLALGLAQNFGKLNLPQPKELILLSPWVDVTLSNPDISKYRKTDPIVFPENVKILGAAWAGTLPLDDYRVSPLFGDTEKITSTHIFCGTREVLYPENLKLKEKLIESGANVEFYLGKGLNHVYPVFPIPEAAAARKAIENIIKKYK